MKKIYIFNDCFFDNKNDILLIGGLYTYIAELAALFFDNNFEVNIIQYSDTSFSKSFQKYNVLGIINSELSLSEYYHNLFNEDNSAIFIIGTDQLDIKAIGDYTITIQHGIAFDKPRFLENNFLKRNFYFSIFYKFLRTYKNVKRFTNSNNLVCVDYNYYNWLKTCYTIYDYNKIHFIPNFSDTLFTTDQIIDKLKSRGNKKILFARRFVDYRGVLIFADAVEKILKKYENVEITFAGDGELKMYLLDRFRNYSNVFITSYEANETLNFHYKYDISVIPTLYSEGTSLSLIEALSAGCFCISTCVGGLQNIIIDNYNGIVIKPTVNDLFDALENAIILEDLEFNRIVNNGYSTAKFGFSKKIWSNKWSNLINSLISND